MRRVPPRDWTTTIALQSGSRTPDPPRGIQCTSISSFSPWKVVNLWRQALQPEPVNGPVGGLTRIWRFDRMATVCHSRSPAHPPEPRHHLRSPHRTLRLASPRRTTPTTPWSNLAAYAAAAEGGNTLRRPPPHRATGSLISWSSSAGPRRGVLLSEVPRKHYGSGMLWGDTARLRARELMACARSASW